MKTSLTVRALTTTCGSGLFNLLTMILKLSFAEAELLPILSQISMIKPQFSLTFFSLVAFSETIVRLKVEISFWFSQSIEFIINPQPQHTKKNGTRRMFTKNYTKKFMS